MFPRHYSIIYSTPKLLIILNGELCVVNYIILRTNISNSVLYMARKRIQFPREYSTITLLSWVGDYFDSSNFSKKLHVVNNAYISDKYNDIRNIITKEEYNDT